MKTSNKLLLGFYGVGAILGLLFLLLVRYNVIKPTKVKGTGPMTMVEKNIQPFAFLRASDQMHIRLVPSPAPYMKVRAHQNIQPYFEYVQEDEHLEIRIVDSIKIVEGGRIEVELGTQRLEGLSMNGVSRVVSDSTLQVDFLNIQLDGAGQVELPLEANQINISSSGASRVVLEGSTDFLGVRGLGASDIRALDLVAEQVNVHVSGATKAYVNPLQFLSVSASGASVVRYKTKPAHLEQSLSGASSLKEM